MAFEQWSRLPEIEHLRQTIQLTNSPETVVLTYGAISQAPFEMLNSNQASKSNGGPPSWFEAECWTMKYRVQQLFLLFRLHPSPELSALYFSSRKNCQQFLEEKKHNFALSRWHMLLEAIFSKNSKTFWHLVSRSNLIPFQSDPLPH